MKKYIISVNNTRVIVIVLDGNIIINYDTAKFNTYIEKENSFIEIYTESDKSINGRYIHDTFNQDDCIIFENGILISV